MKGERGERKELGGCVRIDDSISGTHIVCFFFCLRMKGVLLRAIDTFGYVEGSIAVGFTWRMVRG